MKEFRQLSRISEELLQKALELKSKSYDNPQEFTLQDRKKLRKITHDAMNLSDQVDIIGTQFEERGNQIAPVQSMKQPAVINQPSK